METKADARKELHQELWSNYYAKLEAINSELFKRRDYLLVEIGKLRYWQFDKRKLLKQQLSDITADANRSIQDIQWDTLVTLYANGFSSDLNGREVLVRENILSFKRGAGSTVYYDISIGCA